MTLTPAPADSIRQRHSLLCFFRSLFVMMPTLADLRPLPFLGLSVSHIVGGFVAGFFSHSFLPCRLRREYPFLDRVSSHSPPWQVTCPSESSQNMFRCPASSCAVYAFPPDPPSPNVLFFLSASPTFPQARRQESDPPGRTCDFWLTRAYPFLGFFVQLQDRALPHECRNFSLSASPFLQR